MKRILSILASLVVPVSAAEAPDYALEVKPILERCTVCHGPEKQKSGYRVDVRDLAIRGGDSGQPAIVPHHAASSPLIRYVSGEDEETVMPPKQSSQPRLTAAEVSVLRRWIDAGPAWPDALAGNIKNAKPHWSLTPLVQPRIPSGPAHPVDAFIEAKLAEKGLTPSPEADRRALLRRLSYDLTGLPPAPEEMDAWLEDKHPGAYERDLDRLLASPAYGEHWARHWLDVANYADTHGNDHDYARWNAWPYRDYAIRSFNEDKPYSRFVQEQVAGDALYPDDGQATVALGFLAAGPWDHTLMVTVREDTVDHRMAQNLDRDNMVSTTIGTFQSLTIHCARCHDHKFDPISQRDYYALQAVFAGVDRADRPFDDDSRTQMERTRLLARKRALENPEPALLATLETPEVQQNVNAWEETWARREQAWTPLEALSVVSTGGAALTRQSDGSWFVSGTRPDRDTYIVTAQRPPGKLRALRLEVLPDERLPQKGPGRWDNGNFHLSEFRLFAAPSAAREGARSVAFSQAWSDFDEGPAISAAQAIDGKPETHWGVHPRYGVRHEAVFELKGPAVFPSGTIVTVLIEQQGATPGHGIGRFRLSAMGDGPSESHLQPLPADIAALLQVPSGERTPAQRQALALAALKIQNQTALAALPPPRMVYAVTRDFPPDGPNFKPSSRPRPIHLLTRGDLSKPGDLVGPGTLGCIPGGRGAGRDRGGR